VVSALFHFLSTVGSVHQLNESIKEHASPLWKTWHHMTYLCLEFGTKRRTTKLDLCWSGLVKVTCSQIRWCMLSSVSHR
jgi:hypothetical protein